MHPASNTPALVVRWLARVGSLASLGFIGMFVFGTSEPWVWPQGTEWLGLACFPIALAVGLALAWRWEVCGALVALGGLVGFYFWEYTVSGSWAQGPWFLILASPAVLFLVASLISKASPRVGERSGKAMAQP